MTANDWKNEMGIRNSIKIADEITDRCLSIGFGKMSIDELVEALDTLESYYYWVTIQVGESEAKMKYYEKKMNKYAYAIGGNGDKYQAFSLRLVMAGNKNIDAKEVEKQFDTYSGRYIMIKDLPKCLQSKIYSIKKIIDVRIKQLEAKTTHVEPR